MKNRPHTIRIAYLVKMFPKLSETFILQEILELERLGLPLMILSLCPPSETETHPQFDQLISPVLYAPVVLNEEKGPSIQQSLWTSWITETIREYDITHLHAHYVTEPTDLAWQVHRETGIPYSFTTHAKDLFLSTQEDVARKVKDAQFVLTCTDYNKDYLQQHVQSDTPIYRIYHGVDLDVFTPQHPEVSDEGTTRPFILSIGRFRPKKGFPTLLHACASLKNTGHAFHCVLVGYGPLEHDLQQMIRDLGLDDCVHLTGKVPRDGVLNWYRQASVFVLPCQIAEDGDRDGIPNVLVEAMAMGLPVVSTSIASIPELIQDGSNGLLVSPRHDEALAQALSTLLHDPTRRVSLGLNARKTVEELFCASKNIHDIYTIFSTFTSQASNEHPSPPWQQVLSR